MNGHFPRRIDGLCDRIDRINDWIGHTVKWLIVLLVLSQFAIVVLRYVYATTYAVMLESVMFTHAILLTLGAGYTLLHDGHVRVDIFYGAATKRTQAMIDLGGVLLLLVPTCVFITAFTTGYVGRSWAILEAPLVTSGLGPIYILKSLIPAFAVVLLIQGLSMGLRSIAVLTEPAEKPGQERNRHPS